MLNSEVPYVRYLTGQIVKTYDYINRVVITLPLSVYEGTWTTLSPLVAMHHHDPVCVGIFLKLLRSPTVDNGITSLGEGCDGQDPILSIAQDRVVRLLKLF